MVSSLRAGLAFVRSHSPLVVWRAFMQPENQHPLIQVSKYVLFGVLSVIVYNLVFGSLGWMRIFPHFADQGFTGQQRAFFFVAASAGGFVAANCFAYYTNAKWVFQRGRHQGPKEFLLFTSLASIGFLVGLSFGVREILTASGGSWHASLVLVGCATLVNFLTRKFVIFHA